MTSADYFSPSASVFTNLTIQATRHSWSENGREIVASPPAPPISRQSRAQLNALHLYDMATARSELLAEGPRKPMHPEAWLDRLLDAERVDRQVRSLRYQIKAARFPAHRDLTGIDWAETSLPQAQIEQLASAGFMDRITHHCDILETGNESFRFKQRKNSPSLRNELKTNGRCYLETFQR